MNTIVPAIAAVFVFSAALLAAEPAFEKVVRGDLVKTGGDRNRRPFIIQDRMDFTPHARAQRFGPPLVWGLSQVKGYLGSVLLPERTWNRLDNLL